MRAGCDRHKITSVAALRAQNALQKKIVEGSRLHIPVDFTAESLHSGGHSGTTIFPMGQGVGATWNVSMAERVGAAIAREARASGVAHGLCPVINIPTDPRFGRTQESYGEVSRALTSDAFPASQNL